MISAGIKSACRILKGVYQKQFNQSSQLRKLCVMLVSLLLSGCAGKPEDLFHLYSLVYNTIELMLAFFVIKKINTKGFFNKTIPIQFYFLLVFIFSDLVGLDGVLQDLRYSYYSEDIPCYLLSLWPSILFKLCLFVYIFSPLLLCSIVVKLFLNKDRWLLHVWPTTFFIFYLFFVLAIGYGYNGLFYFVTKVVC